MRANLTRMVNLVIICQGFFENLNEMAKESPLERGDFDRDCENIQLNIQMKCQESRGAGGRAGGAP